MTSCTSCFSSTLRYTSTQLIAVLPGQESPQSNMSQSPITPVKPTEVGNARSAKVAVPSLEKIFSATRVKQASMHEPSPASTYGDTAVGDSVPATPLETQSQGERFLNPACCPGVHNAKVVVDMGSGCPSLHAGTWELVGMCKSGSPDECSSDTAAALINSLQRVQIDDAFESTAGSPLLPRAGKLRAQSERRADLADRTALSEILPSPSKSSIIESLHRHGSTNSSPNASRRKEILESPSWRRRHDFVRRSRDQSEDPFISGNSGNQGSSQSEPELAKRNRISMLITKFQPEYFALAMTD